MNATLIIGIIFAILFVLCLFWRKRFEGGSHQEGAHLIWIVIHVCIMVTFLVAVILTIIGLVPVIRNVI